MAVQHGNVNCWGISEEEKIGIGQFVNVCTGYKLYRVSYCEQFFFLCYWLVDIFSILLYIHIYYEWIIQLNIKYNWIKLPIKRWGVKNTSNGR